MGKILVVVILLSALLAGGGIYYMQEYAFYDEVAGNGTSDVELVNLSTGAPEPVLYTDYEGVDADSSPIRYRACFRTQMSLAMMSETYEAYEAAEPLEGPRWFGCYDASAIGAAIEDGQALAFLAQRDVSYGIDRVVAVDAQGNGWAWHQINRCGREVFDGNAAPEGCPPAPDGTARQ